MLATEGLGRQAVGLQDAAWHRPVQVIAVTSGKGGVGKTNVSANLAVALSSMGQQVLILDADMGLANVDVLLGLNTRATLADVIKGERRLEEVIVEGPAGVRVIPAASGVQAMAELSQAEHVGLIGAFGELSFHPDVLIIDTAAGIASGMTTYARASHETIVVVCDEPASITDAYATIKVLNRDHGLYRFRILANMVGSAQEGMELFHKLVRVSDRFLDVTLDYMGAVPYDDYLRKSIQRQRPVVDCYPRSKAAMAFRKIGTRIRQWPQPEAPRGCIEFFVERLFRQ